jgi:mono/diheme cytochrome c family protein
MLRILAFVVVATVVGVNTAAAQTAAAVERGVKVYAAEKCTVCHSIGDKGNKRGPLDDVGSRLSADDIRAWIVSAPEMTAKTKAQRKPLMKSYTHLPKEDVDALVAYMASLKKK